jgi:hypothetical protein
MIDWVVVISSSPQSQLILEVAIVENPISKAVQGHFKWGGSRGNAKLERLVLSSHHAPIDQPCIAVILFLFLISTT